LLCIILPQDNLLKLFIEIVAYYIQPITYTSCKLWAVRSLLLWNPKRSSPMSQTSTIEPCVESNPLQTSFSAVCIYTASSHVSTYYDSTKMMYQFVYPSCALFISPVFIILLPWCWYSVKGPHRQSPCCADFCILWIDTDDSSKTLFSGQVCTVC
jgi:hypothetical protein